MSEENNEVSVDDLKAQLSEAQEVASSYETRVTAMDKKINELLEETKTAKAKAKSEAEAAEQAKMEKAKKNGDFEQLLHSSEQQRQQLEHELNDWKHKVSAEKVRSESMRLAADLADGANAELLSEFVSRRLKYTDEGVKVLDANGQLTVSGLDDLKKEFEGNDKFKSLLRGNKASGGGAVGNGSGASANKEMTRSSFTKLNPKQQMDFVTKDGGKVIDD